MEHNVVFFFFITGLVFGSFYNVVGLRVPHGKMFSSSRSACPSCHHILSWKELVPLLSFFYQKGKCKHCGKAISPLYPIIELFTAVGFAFCCLFINSPLEIGIGLLLVSMLAIVFVSDHTYMIIPNQVLLFFLPLFIIYRIIVPTNPWWLSVLGGIAGFGLIAIIILLSKGGMGAGDMKLFSVIGYLVGFPHVFLTLFVATIYGLVFFLLQKLLHKGESPLIPFGPSIILAGGTVFFYGSTLLDWYFSLYY
ncbi:prepilin peptidase [Gracilibacillus dipsosauri]|uniref:prepilin peptidase n=1 Tax=Gracilibacillus dipsosauri TaxID=178340 RepID=UPI0024092B69